MSELLDTEYIPDNEIVAYVMQYEKVHRGRIVKTWSLNGTKPWCLNSYEKDRENNTAIEIGHEKINVKVASEHFLFTKAEISASLQFGELYIIYVVEGDGTERKIHKILNLADQGIAQLNWEDLEKSTFIVGALD